MERIYRRDRDEIKKEQIEKRDREDTEDAES